MVLLDIEKIFDKVWIYGLLYKMMQSDYSKILIKLIRSYMKGRFLQMIEPFTHIHLAQLLLRNKYI